MQRYDSRLLQTAPAAPLPMQSPFGAVCSHSAETTKCAFFATSASKLCSAHVSATSCQGAYVGHILAQVQMNPASMLRTHSSVNSFKSARSESRDSDRASSFASATSLTRRQSSPLAAQRSQLLGGGKPLVTCFLPCITSPINTSYNCMRDVMQLDACSACTFIPQGFSNYSQGLQITTYVSLKLHKHRERESDPCITKALTIYAFFHLTFFCAHAQRSLMSRPMVHPTHHLRLASALRCLLLAQTLVSPLETPATSHLRHAGQRLHQSHLSSYGAACRSAILLIAWFQTSQQGHKELTMIVPGNLVAGGATNAAQAERRQARRGACGTGGCSGACIAAIECQTLSVFAAVHAGRPA